MNTTEKKPLFELTGSELEEELSSMFEPFSANHPIRCQVTAALMAAEATTQRLALEMVDPSEKASPPDHEALSVVFETVEALTQFLLEGQPSRIDLVLWDAAGYIHGWFLNQDGHPDLQVGSCPEVVGKLAAALHALALEDKDWRPVLERYAASLAELIRLAREKAEIQARAKVQSQSWFRKFLFPTTLERELLSLGFR